MCLGRGGDGKLNESDELLELGEEQELGLEIEDDGEDLGVWELRVQYLDFRRRLRLDLVSGPTATRTQKNQ